MFRRRFIPMLLVTLALMPGWSCVATAAENETDRQLSPVGPSPAEEEKSPNQISFDVSRSSFNKTFDDWYFASLGYGGRPFGFSFSGRINYANRFDRDGVQFEVDAYPKFRPGTYAYFNVGYSSSSLFPEYRAGAEIFQSLPKSFEGSLGLRHLRFSSSNVTLYTGSIAKYYRSYYFALRPFYRTKSAGSSTSARLMIRKYLSDPKYYATFADWIGVSLGVGSSPEEDVATFELFRLDSQNISVDWRRRIGRRSLITAFAGFERQEIRQGEFRQEISLGVGYRILMLP
jgi:YaiO family outer membrane protein